jgi:hypothetical protein
MALAAGGTKLTGGRSAKLSDIPLSQTPVVGQFENEVFWNS